MSSNIKNISIEGWWMVLITVRPNAATFLTSFMTINALRASSPDVGSSKKKTGAFDTNSTATVSTLRCPGASPVSLPDVPIILCAIESSSKISSASSTKALRVSSEMDGSKRSLALNSSASRTVVNSLCKSICSQYAVKRANVSFFTLCPFNLISPEIMPVFLRPAMTSSRVVLPAPELPMRASMRPGCAADEILCNSCFDTVFSFLSVVLSSMAPLLGVAAATSTV